MKKSLFRWLCENKINIIIILFSLLTCVFLTLTLNDFMNTVSIIIAVPSFVVSFIIFKNNYMLPTHSHLVENINRFSSIAPLSIDVKPTDIDKVRELRQHIEQEIDLKLKRTILPKFKKLKENRDISDINGNLYSQCESFYNDFDNDFQELNNLLSTYNSQDISLIERFPEYINADIKKTMFDYKFQQENYQKLFECISTSSNASKYTAGFSSTNSNEFEETIKILTDMNKFCDFIIDEYLTTVVKLSLHDFKNEIIEDDIEDV